MADIPAYDDDFDPAIADLVAAAECIDLRPTAARHAADLLDAGHPVRFPRQRRGTVVIPDAATASVADWD